MRRFRNRLRGLPDSWGGYRHAGGSGAAGGRMAGVAYAVHADTWRLRRAIFPDGWFAPRGQPVPGA